MAWALDNTSQVSYMGLLPDTHVQHIMRILDKYSHLVSHGIHGMAKRLSVEAGKLARGYFFELEPLSQHAQCDNYFCL